MGMPRTPCIRRKRCRKFSDYMWQRIDSVASEDVGTANNAALPMVVSAYQAYKEHKASPSNSSLSDMLSLYGIVRIEVDDFLVSFRMAGLG